MKFEKSITIMNAILNYQRSPFDNTRLGYDQRTSNEGPIFIMQKDKEGPKGYVAMLKDSIKNEETIIR